MDNFQTKLAYKVRAYNKTSSYMKDNSAIELGFIETLSFETSWSIPELRWLSILFDVLELRKLGYCSMQ